MVMTRAIDKRDKLTKEQQPKCQTNKPSKNAEINGDWAETAESFVIADSILTKQRSKF